MFDRRGFLGLTAAATTATALTACGLDEPAKPGQPGSGASRMTIYTARDKKVAEEVVADFEAAKPEYKGKVTVLTLGAQEALERIRAEKSNPQADIWWGGTRQQMEQGASAGILAKAPQSVLDRVPADSRHADGLWVGEMKLAELFAVNEQALGGAPVPADWDDLLKPAYKDKIVIRDVQASGTMRSIYCAMIDKEFAKSGSPEAGYAWLKQLDANTKVYAANPTDLYLRLNRGEAAVTAWNLQDIMLQVKNEKAQFKPVVPASGAPMLIDGVAKVQGGPSSAGADAFLEFLLSEAEQSKLAESKFQIPTVKLSNEPSWLADLNLKEMKSDWNRINTNEKAWIEYWAANIKGRK